MKIIGSNPWSHGSPQFLLYFPISNHCMKHRCIALSLPYTNNRENILHSSFRYISCNYPLRCALKTLTIGISSYSTVMSICGYNGRPADLYLTLIVVSLIFRESGQRMSSWAENLAEHEMELLQRSFIFLSHHFENKSKQNSKYHNCVQSRKIHWIKRRKKGKNFGIHPWICILEMFSHETLNTFIWFLPLLLDH